MKLIDLEPSWLGFGQPWNQLKIGVSFLSPLGTGQHLGCLFKNPIDPLNLGWLSDPSDNPELYGGMHRWQRSGDTFETLTLTPSLDFSKYNEWHGFITNGEIK